MKRTCREALGHELQDAAQMKERLIIETFVPCQTQNKSPIRFVDIHTHRGHVVLAAGSCNNESKIIKEVLEKLVRKLAPKYRCIGIALYNTSFDGLTLSLRVYPEEDGILKEGQSVKTFPDVTLKHCSGDDQLNWCGGEDLLPQGNHVRASRGNEAFSPRSGRAGWITVA
jgi:hypothetical protein